MSYLPPAEHPAIYMLASPALIRLRRRIANEEVQMWVVLGISALSLWPLGYWLSMLLAMAVPGFEGLAQSAPWPGWIKNILHSLSIASGVGAPVIMLGGLLLPALSAAWAITVYRRELRIVTGDFVWGWAGLCFIDESYSRVIEEARREAFRPSVNPVNYGESLELRLNHFAHYYPLYLQMSQAPCELKVPAITERNCWLDGFVACLGGCLNVCIIGVLVAIPMYFRLLTTWPRVVAVKKTALRFFTGAFDAQIDSLQQRPGYG